MPNTMTLISSSTVGSGGTASISFSSIPNTYTDLVVKLSVRSTASTNNTNIIDFVCKIYLNGNMGTPNSLENIGRLKDNYETIIFNISMFSMFIVVVGGFLLYHYRGKLTPAEIEIKNRKKQEYIVSKLQQMAHLRKNQGLITELPRW